MLKKKDVIEKKTIWERLDIKIKVIGGIIASISAIIAIIAGVNKLYELRWQKPVERCAALGVKTFPKFPYYLVNTYKKAPQNDYI